jgi:phosphoribosylaminoimidazolecarboxamide formyltransferase / IMP cyclohydrolase
MTERQNALLSVYNKDGIVEFADGLVREGFDLYSSSGTYKTIQEAGVPITDIAEVVRGGPILGHKVVTLSREVAAGFLVDPNNEEEMEEFRKLGVPLLHLLCQDSYPLEQAIADPNATKESVLFNTDIGGPNMLREAAKGGRIVLSIAEQRQQVLEWLQAGRPDESEFIEMLAARARYEVARYTMLEAKYWNGAAMSGAIALKHSATKYGENPQQIPAAFYADNRINIDPLGLDQFTHVKGMEKSYVNMIDMDRLLQTSTHIAATLERNMGAVPAMAVGVKHGNACGAAVGETMADAVKKMIEGDSRALHGGVIMLNGEIDEEIANLLMYHAYDGFKFRILDGLVGASVTQDALEVLTREKLRVVVNPALAELGESSIDYGARIRPVRGGFLEQPNYTVIPNLRQAERQAGGWVSPDQELDLALGWAVNVTSNSNTITLVKDGMLIGNGVGQQDRVGAAELAIKRAIDAGHEVEGAVAISDSFFPFPDGPETLVEAGVNVILSTSGSINDEEVFGRMQDLAKEGKLQSFLTFPDKTHRGFFGH